MNIKLNTKVNTKQLYELFFGKKLVNLSKLEPKTPTKAPRPVENILTPMSKKIYDATSPRSKQYVLEDMLADTKAIEEKELKEELSDPDYLEKMENNGLGFYMEKFVSVYGLCPVCGERTLRPYSQSNVPVVDLVCINKDFHLKNDACFIFQVKISLTNDYFSLAKQTISVGSIVYGEPAHMHKGTDHIKEKVVVPGYICIKLYSHATELQTYLVDYRNSFVLVPDYNNTNPDYYYKYIDVLNKYGKSIITWDQTMVDAIEFKNILTMPKIVHEYFSEEVIDNPYANLKKILG